jgi:hypothetical protein
MANPPFQALTIKSSGLATRIITTIGVSEAHNPASKPSLLPEEVQTRALWDTGASGSVISAGVAQSLGLVAVGQVIVNHAGGSGPSPTYVVNLKLPNQVVIAGALVTELAQPSAEFAVIVGMDVISLGDFSITNVRGQTWMSFRTPSCVAIDYVEEHNRLMFAGVGRNDPCPCGKRNEQGNAVKFKKCHGQ